jgi:hypothetical protein
MHAMNCKSFVLPLGLLLLGATFFASCKRETVTFDGELYSALDNSFAESEFSAIRSMMDTEARADSNVFGKTGSTTGFYCPDAVITIANLTATGAEMTIDFGSGTNCLDGRLRTGQLKGVFSGKWKDAGSSVVITPTNYTVSGYSLSFTETITYEGLNTDNDPYWTTVVANGVINHPTEGGTSWSCDRTTTWVEGAGDLDPANNVYTVFGTANGVSRQGVSYVVNVNAATALRVETGCQYITSGVLVLTPAQRTARNIDYGTGVCDNQATFSVGSYVQAITLP